MYSYSFMDFFRRPNFHLRKNFVLPRGNLNSEAHVGCYCSTDKLHINGCTPGFSSVNLQIMPGIKLTIKNKISIIEFIKGISHQMSFNMFIKTLN